MMQSRMSRARAEKVEHALHEIRAGRMVILVDDEDRENEGDLVLAADCVTPEAVNFMRKHAGGLICLALSEEKVERLGLDMMTSDNRSPRSTAFTVSIEARQGVSTGISAADRAHTIRVAARKDARLGDVVSPGHVFPLRARRGGVLVRSGHTEGSIDLATLSGLEPAAVICEIMNDDGSMARMPELEKFAAEHGLHILSIADLIEYRMQRESLVDRTFDGKVSLAMLGGPDLECRGVAFRSTVERTEYLGLVLGDITAPGDAPLVRVQSACIPGDVFGSRACDCGPQLRRAIDIIAAEGRGVLLYVFPAGRVSMLADIERHVAHRAPATGVSAEQLRDFGLGAQALRQLGLDRIRLLTNNPKKIVGLSGFGIEVEGRVPLAIAPTKHNVTFLSERARAGEQVAEGAAIGGAADRGGAR